MKEKNHHNTHCKTCSTHQTTSCRKTKSPLHDEPYWTFWFQQACVSYITEWLELQSFRDFSNGRKTGSRREIGKRQLAEFMYDAFISENDGPFPPGLLPKLFRTALQDAGYRVLKNSKRYYIEIINKDDDA